MEEIINIIKEIKKIEKLNNEMEDNRSYIIDTRNTEKTEKTYSNDLEGELLQEFDETKDVYRKRELAEQIKTARTNRLNQLNEKLDKAIEEKSAQLKNELEEKKSKIEENKNAMYTMKNNRDMLKEHMNDNKAWQRTYDLIGENMRYKREENVLLNKEIKKIESKMEELKNRNFEKILEELEEQKNKEQHVEAEHKVEQKMEQQKQEEKEVEQQEKVEQEIEQPKQEEKEVEQQEEVKQEIEQPRQEKQVVEPVKKQTEQTESAQMPPVTNNILDNAEIVDDDNNLKNKITIYYDSADIELSKYKFSLDLFKEDDIITETMDSLSDTTKNKLTSTMDMSRDGTIIKALLVDEEKLNDYLDICSLYNYRYEPIPEIENVIEEYQAPEDFPTIEYNLKESKHDNRKLNNAEKIEMYNRAKTTQKMFKYLNMPDKVSIKISLLDKIYCDASNFVKEFKNGIGSLKNRLSLGPGKEEKFTNKDLEDSQVIEAGKTPEQEKEPSLRERVKVDKDTEELEYIEFKKMLDEVRAKRHEQQNKEEEKE